VNLWLAIPRPKTAAGLGRARTLHEFTKIALATQRT
jgi:hypothetical protein